MVRYYQQLAGEREWAKRVLHSKKDPEWGAADLQKFKADKKKAKEILGRNMQKMCQEKFGPIVGKCWVCKWVTAANNEKWELLPESVRTRALQTSSSWRLKHGLSKRGRGIGGRVPHILQRELDCLMSEFSQGKSDVTERAEAVSVDDIATCKIQRF